MHTEERLQNFINAFANECWRHEKKWNDEKSNSVSNWIYLVSSTTIWLMELMIVPLFKLLKYSTIKWIMNSAEKKRTREANKKTHLVWMDNIQMAIDVNWFKSTAQCQPSKLFQLKIQQHTVFKLHFMLFRVPNNFIFYTNSDMHIFIVEHLTCHKAVQLKRIIVRVSHSKKVTMHRINLH